MEISAAESSAKEWFLKYVDACKTHVDVTGNISILFRTVPGYIDGPRAYYALHREPGMPIGRSDMIIATQEPFQSFWKSFVNEVRYFREYQKEVRVDVFSSPSKKKILLVDRLPFNGRAKLAAAESA